MRDPLRDQQERVRDRLKNYKDYEDFLNRYEHHREKSGAREHLMRGEGFKELNQKYGTEYDFYEKADQENDDKYIKYRERYYEQYWDTKENHAYYSQPVSTRAWIQFKKVISFYWDLAMVWGLFAGVFVLYNAHTTSKKINVSHTYLQIFKTGSISHLNMNGHLDFKYTDDDFAPKYKHLRPKTTAEAEGNERTSEA